MIRQSVSGLAKEIMRFFNKLARDRTQNRYPLLLIARAHDPPKCERFGEEIMRFFKKLARDRTQNRYPLLLIARL